MLRLKHKLNLFILCIGLGLGLFAYFTPLTSALSCPGAAQPVTFGNVTECPVVQTQDSTPKNGCGSVDPAKSATKGPQVLTSIDFGCQGDVCTPGNANYAPGNVYCSQYHNPVIDLLFSLLLFLTDGVGIVVVASVILGGIQFTLARDNPDAANKARQRISTSLIALLLFVFAYGLLNYLIPQGFFN
jgi:hypothetical protein